MQSQSPQTLHRSKIIVRQLPPKCPAETFSEMVQAWLPFTDFLDYIPGKTWPSQPLRMPIPSRAYLAFTSAEKLIGFTETMSGRTQSDEDGRIWTIQVEFAPFQAIPSTKEQDKPDSLVGTIDSQYIKFVEDLQKTSETLPLDKQVEIVEARERELAPWKFEVGREAKTPLLIHLRKLASSSSQAGKGKNKGRSKTTKPVKNESSESHAKTTKSGRKKKIGSEPQRSSIQPKIMTRPTKPTSSDSTLTETLSSGSQSTSRQSRDSERHNANISSSKQATHAQLESTTTQPSPGQPIKRIFTTGRSNLKNGKQSGVVGLAGSTVSTTTTTTNTK